RWGNLLYQVENVAPDGSAVAWDGRSRGDYVLPGVYAWMMELELVDDTVEKYRGDVTVIR
ncbi:MAG: gliding motility-associated C-terminal domain-containing protein, partial [Saprospiraceae bacterium]|nr:gliding motility-associated C-terminal domain-containing protein [Saprospiraceae bacterium]